MHEAAVEPDTIEVSLGSGVATGAADYARVKIGRALEHTPEPVLDASVRIMIEHHPARLITAAADIDINGRPVHVDSNDMTEWEAIDLLEDRLRQRISRL